MTRAASSAEGGIRPSQSVAIRPVRPDEYERLGELIVAAYRAVPGSPDAPSYEEELRAVAERAASSTVLVAVLDGMVLGGVTYVAGPEDPYAELLEEGDAGIRMLAVAPETQGRGIGRVLVEACIDRARDARRRRIVLHTTPWMTRAQRLYERIGFHRAPDLDWNPLPYVRLLAYVLDLATADGGERASPDA